jgi:hypothetical protein
MSLNSGFGGLEAEFASGGGIGTGGIWRRFGGIVGRTAGIGGDDTSRPLSLMNRAMAGETVEVGCEMSWPISSFGSGSTAIDPGPCLAEHGAAEDPAISEARARTVTRPTILLPTGSARFTGFSLGSGDWDRFGRERLA